MMCISIDFFSVASFPYYPGVIRVIIFPIHALSYVQVKSCVLFCVSPYTLHTPLLGGQYFTPIFCLCAICKCRWCLKIFNWDAPWKLTTLRIFFLSHLFVYFLGFGFVVCFFFLIFCLVLVSSCDLHVFLLIFVLCFIFVGPSILMQISGLK